MCLLEASFVAYFLKFPVFINIIFLNFFPKEQFRETDRKNKNTAIL